MRNILLYILIACTIFVAYATTTVSLLYWRKAIWLLGWRKAIISSFHHVRLTMHQSLLAMFVRLPGISTVFFIAGLSQLFGRWSGNKIDVWFCASLMLAFMAFAHHAINMLPITALLLSTSGEEADRLHTAITRSSVGILPFNLLGEGRYPGTESFRTSRGNWERIVVELVDTVPIVILDTRFITPAVLKEATWLLSSPARAHRTFFLTDDQGRYPVLSQLLAQGSRAVTIGSATLVTEQELLAALRKMTSAQESLPTSKSIPDSL